MPWLFTRPRLTGKGKSPESLGRKVEEVSDGDGDTRIPERGDTRETSDGTVYG